MGSAENATTPTSVDQHIKFSQAGQLSTPEEWVTRARDVAQNLTLDAPQRDIRDKSPSNEIQLLKASGLTSSWDPGKHRVQNLILDNNWFIGSAVNSRHADLKTTSDGDEIVFNG
ncbi:hypothetical protein AYL99_00219 [Fonsecaea erecta]|uniref:Uncharacterized protein n=1 Tax=Fonsecaea erecta TaxID=1367422 RepID=A0A178ZX28_9EURO|nr:hypothetical protein AYL99_00219 [Fonsecaea erecta]OAP64247.1 hypothetical protein AYL99_00219 [Fonsecaea erecta]